MLKNVTVAIMMHSDEAVVQNALRWHLRCKRGHDIMTEEGLDLQGKKRVTCSSNVQIGSNLRQQSYSVLYCKIHPKSNLYFTK